MNYRKLEQLTHLLESGTLNQEEFEKEKASILREEECISVYGIAENSYLGVMNFMLLIPGFGWILALLMWAIGYNDSPLVGKQGKNILNWIVSYICYLIVLGYFVTGNFHLAIPTASPYLSLTGGAFGMFMVPFSLLIAVIFIFPIIGGVKGLQGKAWYYPLAIPIFQ